MHDYKATVISIYDGDTITVSVDLGFHISQIMSVRLARINSPEIRGNSKELGQSSLAFLQKTFIIGQQIMLKTYKDGREKYGRYLAEIFIDDNPTSVNDQMVQAGYAVYKIY
jgi:micrococcal nuclease